MDFKTALRKEHTKALTLEIASIVLKQPQRLQELWEIVTSAEPPLPQRASWTLDAISEEAPHLFLPYQREAVDLLQRKVHNAVHRNIAKVLMRIEVEEDIQGLLYDICLEKILDPNEKVAIQVHCMTIAYNIANNIPELCTELAVVIESGMEYGSAGFRSKGRKLLKKLK